MHSYMELAQLLLTDLSGNQWKRDNAHHKTVLKYLKICYRNTVRQILVYKKNNTTLLENTAYACK